MIYGIEQSTDLRCKQTVIKKFGSIKTAQKWAKNSGGFTYRNPEAARNYHHTFRYLYEFFGRLPKKEVKVEMSYSTSTYPVTEADAKARIIMRHGKKVTK